MSETVTKYAVVTHWTDEEKMVAMLAVKAWQQIQQAGTVEIRRVKGATQVFVLHREQVVSSTWSNRVG